VDSYAHRCAQVGDRRSAIVIVGSGGRASVLLGAIKLRR